MQFYRQIISMCTCQRQDEETTAENTPEEEIRSDVIPRAQVLHNYLTGKDYTDKLHAASSAVREIWREISFGLLLNMLIA